jgi:hypothetical protein
MWHERANFLSPPELARFIAALPAAPHPPPSGPLSRNPPFLEKVGQMGLELRPLVQLTTGDVHPAFPWTMLQFWLLCDAQLDSMAAFYHQAEMSEWTLQYPCPVAWHRRLPLEEKRRRFGRFIGLRGCESVADDEGEEEEEGAWDDEIVREWARQARYRDEDDDAVKRKTLWHF